MWNICSDGATSLSLCPRFHQQVEVAGGQEYQVDHVVSALPADGEPLNAVTTLAAVMGG